MPRWERLLPEDKAPHHALKNAELYLQGRLLPENILEMAANLRVHVDDLNFANKGEVLDYHVGNAAASAACVAIIDEQFDNDGLEASITERDIDPHDWDAAFYSAIVYSGGSPFQTKRGIEDRRAFWTWYLDDAIPSVL